MADRQDTNPILQDSIADGIRKALQVGLATAKGGRREGLWIHLDQSHHSFQLLEELISQACFALIIPAASLIDLPLNGSVVGELHARRRDAKRAMKSWWLISWDGSRSSSASR